LKPGIYLSLAIAAILVVGVVSYLEDSGPRAPSNAVLRVGYPESVDEGDVVDLYAFQLLASEGVKVTPTYYGSPPLNYEGLVAGQQDVIFDETMGSLLSGQNTTCVGGTWLGGPYLAIAGEGITKPSEMLGKTAADFGPGSILRDLNEYWFARAGIQVSTAGTSPNSVYLENSGVDLVTLNDLLTGQAQEIVLDDFIISDLSGVNDTAHHGPFHVLFTAPNTVFAHCYAVKDSWLSDPSNQLILEKFLAAAYQAQRHFISNPDQFVTFAEEQMGENSSSEVQFVSTYYPGQMVYWPYGLYNLQGNQSLQAKYNDTNQFFATAGLLANPVANESVGPFGVFNKYFELKALEMLGPYDYPKESWVTPAFESEIQSWVPPWMTGSGNST
jgi:ABC-type nitrate/sulfonate/bicarbonate transport system substrate-binding protein